MPAMKFFPFFVLMAIASTANAQPPANPIISPEVHADRTVTFRLLAPNAKEVQVGGEFSAKPLSMTKDEKGVWLITTEPLEPNTYGYNFIMDGLTMPDPNNTHVRVGALWFATQVDVPGEKPAFFAAQDVPHGTLHGHWYYSKALKTVRHVNVYTPPRYTASEEKPYPVLYLLHGMGDDEGFWTQVGYANFIMDNLLAEGKAKPALIVMPFGHLTRTVRWFPGAARGAGIPGGNEYRGGPVFGVEMLEKDLLENVIPLVEREYRVGKESNQRAIAGLSMGGYQALSIGLNNLQRFAYVGAFSSAILNQNLKNDFQSILTDPEKANKEIKLLWIGCGADDKLLSGNRKFEELLSARGINHQWVTTPGSGHVWTLWRVYLRDLLPQLFEGN
jgi:enterochelin esterase family protein